MAFCQNPLKRGVKISLVFSPAYTLVGLVVLTEGGWKNLIFGII